MRNCERPPVATSLLPVLALCCLTTTHTVSLGAAALPLPLAPSATEAGAPLVRAAVYVGPGTTWRARANVPLVLNYTGSGILVSTVTADAVRAGELSKRGFDVVVFPGGGGGEQSSALGATGRAAVESFVKEGGGGYVGICAGAYLAIQHLQLSAFEDEPRPRPGRSRGDGNCTLTPTPAGQKQLPGAPPPSSFSGLDVFYANGPVMRLRNASHSSGSASLRGRPAAGGLSLSSAAALVTFTSSSVPIEAHYSGPWAGGGAVAVAINDAGAGRVLVSGPHPETDPMDMPKTDGPPSAPASPRAALLQSYVRAVARGARGASARD